jgi:hypothetical protein
LIEYDAFGFQKLPLDLVSVIAKGNFSVTIDNPMPGKPVSFRAAVKYPGNLPGALWVSRQAGKESIGTYLSFGNLFYKGFYL